MLALICESGPAFAETWIQTYKTDGRYAARVEVDADSIQVAGFILRYRTRYNDYYVTEFRYETVAANCSERTRGDWTDMRMYSVYPNTKNGAEVEFACGEAQRRGLLSSASARVAPRPRQEAAAPEVTREPTPAATKRTVSSGSGFIVAARTVVTNFHVVDGCASFSIRRDTTTYRAMLLATAPRSDLALLGVDFLSSGAPPIRAGALLGEDVMVAGHPLSGLLSSDLIVTVGQVNSLAGMGNDPQFLQISAPVQPGSSGGPVIDRSGAIVGVVVSKVNVERLAKVTGDMAQNINFAIKPEVLRMFLDANRVGYKSAMMGKRIDGVDLAERARGFTIQVLCEN